MTRILLFLLLLMGWTSALHAGVSLSAHCDGDTIQGSVYVLVSPFDLGFPQEDWIGLVVQRRMLGSCGSEHIVTPEPFPFPEPQIPYSDVTYDFSEPVPWPNRYFYYEAMAIDNGGYLHHVPGMGDPLPFAHVPCGEAVASRGHLVIIDWVYFQAVLEPCPGMCWEWLILSLGDLDPEEIIPLLYVPVNVYGDYWDYGMPSPTNFFLDHIEPTLNGECGPTPVVVRTWGTLKQAYR